MAEGNLPELNAYMAKIAQENGSSLEDVDFTSMADAMKEKFTSGSEDVTSLDPEIMAIAQKMMELGVIKSEAKPDMDMIWSTGGEMLLVALLSGICTIAVSFMASRISVKLAANLRNTVFAHVEKFSLNEFNKLSTSSLITRTTNDVQQIQTVIFMILRMVISAPIMGIGAIIMATRKSTSLAMNLIYVVPIICLVIFLIARKALPLFRTQQKKLDKLNGVARENLTGVRAIRAYNKSEYEKERFDDANKDLTSVALKVNKLMALMMPIMVMIMNVTVVATMWVGAHQVDLGNIQVGDIMAFIQYAFQIMFSLMMFAMMFVMLPRASASAERIDEVLKTEPEIKEPEKPVEENMDKKGYVEFKNVSFKYPGAEKPVLENISFKLKPGETTAIIGGTGSRKVYNYKPYHAFL